MRQRAFAVFSFLFFSAHFLFVDVLCFIVPLCDDDVFCFEDGVVCIHTCIIWLIDFVMCADLFVLLIEFMWNALLEIFRCSTVGECVCVLSVGSYWEQSLGI